jgi:hypothetical protein
MFDKHPEAIEMKECLEVPTDLRVLKMLALENAVERLHYGFVGSVEC